MKIYFILISFIWLSACNQSKETNLVTDLLNQELSDVTEDEIEGIWEARFTSDLGVQQVWRVRVEEDLLTLAARCRFNSRSITTGAEVAIDLIDQGSRFVSTFQENRDFIVSNGEITCGARAVEGESLFLRLKDGLLLNLSPGFNDIDFEKISDLVD